MLASQTMALGPHPEFSWSASRARAFDYCSRQYWFQYYGSWLGWEDTAPARTKEIYLLKNRQSLPTWSGSAVHRGVALMFGGGGPPERVVEQIHQEMRGDYVSSVRREFRKPGRAKAFGLDVHAYDQDVPRERFAEMWDKVKRCLETFPELPYLSQFDEAAAASRFHVAEPPDGGNFDSRRFRWEEIGDFYIFAQPDVTFERPDGVIEVLDWKTGRTPSNRGPDDVTLQIVLYARFLQDRHPASPAAHRFRAAEVYLPSGDRYGRMLENADIERVAQQVADSVEQMRNLLDDAPRNIASEENFALTEATQKCTGCLFRRVCPRWEELAMGS